ncbi:hypothetical protein B0T19DRAFT_423869 [Cercophora scortea]|uniref:Uncharacterized protein n=1 Tax=Cercophora scortea TaxID=314031 RepID=A0AAE0MDX9_9PEZI|nr:hypothetical protein B0T19DRAFT_423869 [Cercophora scortea]
MTSGRLSQISRLSSFFCPGIMAAMASPEKYILELAAASFDEAALWVMNDPSSAGIAEDGTIDIKDLRDQMLREIEKKMQNDRLAAIAQSSLAVGSEAQSVQSDTRPSIPRHMIRVRRSPGDVALPVPDETAAPAQAATPAQAEAAAQDPAPAPDPKASGASDLMFILGRALNVEEDHEPRDDEMEVESLLSDPPEDFEMGNSEIGGAEQLEDTQAEEQVVQMEVDAQIHDDLSQGSQEVPQQTAIQLEGSKTWRCLLNDIQDPNIPCIIRINRKGDIRSHNERNHHLFAPGSSREYTTDIRWIEKLKKSVREFRLGVEKEMLRELEARCRRARHLLLRSNALDPAEAPEEPGPVALGSFTYAPQSLSQLRVKLHQWWAVEKRYGEMLRESGLEQVFAASEDGIRRGT